MRTYVALAMAFSCGTVDGLLSSCRCRLTGYVTFNRLRGFGVAFWVGGVLMRPPGRVHVSGVALQFAVHAGHTKPWDDLFFVGSLARRWL